MPRSEPRRDGSAVPRLSPTFLVSLLSGAMGVAFSVAYLVLAAVLEKEAFARLALAVALINMASPLATMGIDRVVVRRDIPASDRLLVMSALPAVGMATVIAGSAHLVYGFDLLSSAIMFLCVVGGGLSQFLSGEFQRRQSFSASILWAQGSALALLGAGLILPFLPASGETFVLVLFLAALALPPTIAWPIVLLANRERTSEPADPFPWGESVFLLFVVGATMALLNVERLTIPKVLGLTTLADYSVVATLVLGPFRAMHMGVGKTLLPRLANAATAAERRRIARSETALLVLLSVPGSIVLALATPWLVELLYGGEYRAPLLLVLALLFGGWVRVAATVADAAVTALVSHRWISVWSAVGWGCVGLGGIGAVVGARWGLEGLVLGASVAWLVRALAGMAMTRRYFDLDRARPPVGASGASP